MSEETLFSFSFAKSGKSNRSLEHNRLNYLLNLDPSKRRAKKQASKIIHECNKFTIGDYKSESGKRKNHIVTRRQHRKAKNVINEKTDENLKTSVIKGDFPLKELERLKERSKSSDAIEKTKAESNEKNEISDDSMNLSPLENSDSVAKETLIIQSPKFENTSQSVLVDSYVLKCQNLNNFEPKILNIPITKAKPQFCSMEDFKFSACPKLDGVYGYTFYCNPSLAAGYLKIDPQTLYPFRSLLDCSVIYWVLEGEITFVTNILAPSLNSAKPNFHKEVKGVHSSIFVPPTVPFQLENHTDNEVTLAYNIFYNPVQNNPAPDVT